MRHVETLIRRSVRWLVFGRLLTMRTAVITVTTALFFGGCAARRTTSETSSYVSEHRQRTSLVEVTERALSPLLVAGSSVSLTISTDSLRHLPSGASYHAMSGRARVQVTRECQSGDEPERIVVWATCDSLLLLCESQVRTISELRDTLSHVRSSSSRENQTVPPQSRFRHFLSGMVTGSFVTTCLLFILLTIKKKRNGL